MVPKLRDVVLKAFLPGHVHRRLRMYAIDIGKTIPKTVVAILDKHLPDYPKRGKV